MFVDLGVVSIDEIVDVADDAVLLENDLLLEQLIIVVLVEVQVALEEPMIEVQRGQLLQVLLVVLPVALDHVEQEVLHLVDVVHEDLQEVLNPHFLVLLLDLVVLERLADELLVLLELNQRVHYLPDQPLQLINKSGLVQVEEGGRYLSLEPFHLLNSFEELGRVELETLHLFLEVRDVLVDDLDGLGGVLAVLDLDLHEEGPLFGLHGELLRLVQGVLLLSTDFNSSSDIEDSLFASTATGLLDQLSDLLRLLSLHIAVQQQRCVVFVVVSHDNTSTLSSTYTSLTGGRVNQLLKILDQVGELRHLDVALNHIGRVQIPDGLDELLQGIIELFFLIEVIRMFLADLSDDLPWEVGCLGYILGLCKEPLLQQGLYLYIILHLIELKELLNKDRGLTLCTDYGGGCQNIDSVLLHLNKEDLGVGLAKNSQFVAEIVD